MKKWEKFWKKYLRLLGVICFAGVVISIAFGFWVDSRILKRLCFGFYELFLAFGVFLLLMGCFYPRDDGGKLDWGWCVRLFMKWKGVVHGLVKCFKKEGCVSIIVAVLTLGSVIVCYLGGSLWAFSDVISEAISKANPYFDAVVYKVENFFEEAREAKWEADRIKLEAKREIDCEVTVGEIVSEFADNELVAGKKYYGKRVLITGCLARNPSGTYGKPVYFHLRECGDSSLPTQMVAGRMFPEYYDNCLDSLREGREVKMECTIVDERGSAAVEGDWCVFVRKRECWIKDSSGTWFWSECR